MRSKTLSGLQLCNLLVNNSELRAIRNRNTRTGLTEKSQKDANIWPSIYTPVFANFGVFCGQ